MAQIAAAAYGGPQGAALFSAVSSYSQTGSLTAALTAGVKTYLTAQAFNQIGAPSVDGFDVANIAANAAVGCATSAANGGSSGAGALSAGFSAGIGNSGWIKGSWGPTANTFARAVVGGTASVLGGGKFENGAATGAFTYLYAYGQQIYNRGYDLSKENVFGESLNVAKGGILNQSAIRAARDDAFGNLDELHGSQFPSGFYECTKGICVGTKGTIDYTKPALIKPGTLYPPDPRDLPENCKCIIQKVRPTRDQNFMENFLKDIR